MKVGYVNTIPTGIGAVLFLTTAWKLWLETPVRVGAFVTFLIIGTVALAVCLALALATAFPEKED